MTPTLRRLLSRFKISDVITFKPIPRSGHLGLLAPYHSSISSSSFVPNSSCVFRCIPLALSAAVVLVCASTLPNEDIERSCKWTVTTNLQSGCDSPSRDGGGKDDDETTDVINWSGTHKVSVLNSNYWEPESVEEVEEIIRACHETGQTVRPLGSSLSPNGIALNKDGMISMANIDRVLEIDTEAKTITVEAGMTVSKVCIRYLRIGAELLCSDGIDPPFFVGFFPCTLRIVIFSLVLGHRGVEASQSDAAEFGVHRRAANGRIYPSRCSRYWQTGCTS